MNKSKNQGGKNCFYERNIKNLPEIADFPGDDAAGSPAVVLFHFCAELIAPLCDAVGGLVRLVRVVECEPAEETVLIRR